MRKFLSLIRVAVLWFLVSVWDLVSGLFILTVFPFRVLIRTRKQLFFRARIWFALCLFALCGLILAVWAVAPQNVPVIAYKVALLGAGGLAGYILDRALFRYAEPSGYLENDWRKSPDADEPGLADYPIVVGYHLPFLVAQVRQAAIIVAAMLAVGLGL